MKYYRIGVDLYPIFDGGGAFRHGGRWTSRGRRVIYASPNISCARLEVMVNLDSSDPQFKHKWIEIDVQDDVRRDVCDPPMSPDELSIASCRAMGDAWFDDGQTALLLVPSVASFPEFNLLINQDHPGFERLVASQPRSLHWDKRIQALYAPKAV